MPDRPFLRRSEIIFFSVLAGLVILFLGISFFIGFHNAPAVKPEQNLSAEQAEFDSVNIVAKAAYVLDVRTGTVLFEKNPDERLPLASVTKVMTALVASNLAPPYTTITIPEQAVLVEGDSGLNVGERFRLDDLMNFSLTASSNDGMSAIAMNLGGESAFIANMNKEADTLGMQDTYYLNETGLDQSTTQAGAYGSVKDMATLFSYVLTHKPELLEATQVPTLTVESLDGVSHTAENTDAIVGGIPGILGSKTGSTDLAGGNLVVAFDPDLNHPIIIALLGSTDDGRFTDMETLVADTMRAVSTAPIALK